MQPTPGIPLALFWLGKGVFQERTGEHRPGPLGSRRPERRPIPPDRELRGSSSPPAGPSSPASGKAATFPRVKSRGSAGRRDARFLRPSWVHPLPDGGFYLVSHGTGEILRVDVNGVIRGRFRGGLGGFDRPFSLAPAPDGGFWVSEFQGDRISRCDPDGAVLSRIAGGKGRERLSGPQHLASDPGVPVCGGLRQREGGRSTPRAGEFLLEFGQANPVAFRDSDPPRASRSGTAGSTSRIRSERPSTCSTIPGITSTDSPEIRHLLGPEGLSFAGTGELLIADRRRVLAVDVGSFDQREIYRSPRPGRPGSSAPLWMPTETCLPPISTRPSWKSCPIPR
ncbi:MAG: hypothetical protein MZU95_08490 [Desulfomicrobium escambiense]|nr:hypothetical protein [Desulfomicrobium escambiense]